MLLTSRSDVESISSKFLGLGIEDDARHWMRITYKRRGIKPQVDKLLRENKTVRSHSPSMEARD